MITFNEARAQVIADMVPITEVETIPVTQTLGRVLAQPMIAPFSVPNHDNSAMDGYGVRMADLSSTGAVELRVIGDLPAGGLPHDSLQEGEAVRIMTGAPIPQGCDVVVIQEVVIREGNRVVIPPGQKRLQNIRPVGGDIRQGTEALPQGRRLNPADMGVLASLGLARVPVIRRLRVALLSTGNEVTPLNQPLPPGGVYDSNRVSLTGALLALGTEVIDLGLVRDQRDEILFALEHGTQVADVIISSGGVSVGDFDLVKSVLSAQGEIQFWKVAMKPGKPLAYGRLKQTAFFGLPGNPVSSLVVFYLLVRPALLRLMGARSEIERYLRLPLRGGVRKNHNRVDFLRGMIHFDPNGAWVESVGEQGSNILSGMAKANALIVLPQSPIEIPDGGLVDVLELNYVGLP